MAIFEFDYPKEDIISPPVATKAGQLQHLFFAPKIKFAREYAKAVDILQDTLALEPEPAFAFPGVRKLLPSVFQRDEPILGGEVTFEETKQAAINLFPTVVKGIIEEHEEAEKGGLAQFRLVAAGARAMPVDVLQDMVEEEIKTETRTVYETSILREYETIIHEKEIIERETGGGIDITFPKWPEMPDIFGGLGDIFEGIKGWALPIAIVVGAYFFTRKK